MVTFKTSRPGGMVIPRFQEASPMERQPNAHPPVAPAQPAPEASAAAATVAPSIAPARGNKVLTKMLDRLFSALVNGPSLNCRPHSSRQARRTRPARTGAARPRAPRAGDTSHHRARRRASAKQGNIGASTERGKAQARSAPRELPRRPPRTKPPALRRRFERQVQPGEYFCLVTKTSMPAPRRKHRTT